MLVSPVAGEYGGMPRAQQRERLPVERKLTPQVVGRGLPGSRVAGRGLAATARWSGSILWPARRARADGATDDDLAERPLSDGDGGSVMSTIFDSDERAAGRHCRHHAGPNAARVADPGRRLRVVPARRAVTLAGAFLAAQSVR